MKTSTRLSAAVATVLACTLLASPVPAQTPGGSAQQGSEPAPSGTGRQEQGAAMSGTAGFRGSDVLSAPEFVRLAASNAMFEVETGRLALERARDERLRSFAEKMIGAHEEAQQELRRVADESGASGVRMPQAPAEQHGTWLEQLRSVQGDEFEALYAQQRALSHLVAIDLFRNYSQAGDDDALRRWAGQRLPVMQDHLREAQALKGGAP